jgi:hypothetical protein
MCKDDNFSSMKNKTKNKKESKNNSIAKRNSIEKKFSSPIAAFFQIFFCCGTERKRTMNERRKKTEIK